VNGRIHLSPPDVGADEEAAVLRALRSGWIAPLGPEVDEFERELAERTHRQHAVALSSGTAALHLALLQFNARPGTVVVTSSMTFAATANAICYTGAAPVFVDSDVSGNMSPDLLAQALADQRRRGNEVAAVLPVDLLGKIAAYESLQGLADDAEVPLIADAAESLGATREGQPAGSHGVAAAISFNGNKIITTSGGGALVTDRADVAERTRYLATQARQPVVHYEHTEVGYNYRLSNILAALGRAQLARLDSMIMRRRAWRARYRSVFAGVSGVSILGDTTDHETAPIAVDNHWLTSVIIDESRAGWSAPELVAFLGRRDIEARPLWKPMHLQPVFHGARAYLDGTSERLFRSGLSLPSGSKMSDSDFLRVEDALRDFVGGVR
jgi:dTDP-4-amino-4,6-dideoxygalactose transaminase